jgi:DME family drug/metabolite transporter
LFEDGVEAFELSQARSYVAFTGLYLIWRFGPSARRDEGLRGHSKPVTQILLLGAAIGLVNAAYYTAIDHLAVAVAIVIQYSAPALVVAWIALRARSSPGPRILITVTAALLGVALAAGVRPGQLSDVDPVGFLAAACSAVLFAAYTLLSESAAGHYGPVGALTRAFGVSSGLWILFQSTQGWPHALFAPDNIVRVVYVGVVGTLAPFLLYVWGVRRVAAQKGVIAATLEPPLAAFFAWLWLSEALTPIQITGSALVLVAVASLQYQRREFVVPEQ